MKFLQNDAILPENSLRVDLFIPSGVRSVRDGVGSRGGFGEGAETCVHKMAVSVNVGQCLPHHATLRQEALVGHQQEQLVLYKFKKTN
jgi:hypothetical protein